MFFFIQLFVLDFFMTSLQKPAESRRQKSKACRNGQKKQIREVNSETDKASKLETRHQNTKACRNSQKNKSGKITPKPTKRLNWKPGIKIQKPAEIVKRTNPGRKLRNRQSVKIENPAS